MRRAVWILGVAILAVAPLLFAVYPASAWVCPSAGQSPSDFLTGGGFILLPDANRNLVVHANFGVGGSCKKGGDGHGLWGHLEYIDHGSALTTPPGAMLNVHWETITAYLVDVVSGDNQHARVICGMARTNLFGDGEHFAVRASDIAEPGRGHDQFDIVVTHTGTTGEVIDYTTGPPPGGTFVAHILAGGNIQLHKPITLTQTPVGESCPALLPYGISI